MKLQATLDLFHRYTQVFRHAWGVRKQLDGLVRLGHEAEFLPAALALQETPVHPAPRIAMGLIMLFAFLALIWAVFGKIDIVASAQGKLIPDDRSKVIQPMETAVIQAIHVRDGQTVKAGDLLIELDATVAQADSTRVGEDLLAAQLEGARASALLDALAANGQRGKRPVMALAGVDAIRIAAEQRLLAGELAAFTTQIDQIDAAIARRVAELHTTEETVRKLAQTAPIAHARAEDYKNLLAQNFVSRHGYLEREQARIEQEQDLATQRAKLAELKAAIAEGGRQRSALLAETRRVALDRLHQAEQKIAGLSQERVKAESRDQLMRLTAPVAGTVQQLAVHTVGGVVTPAQPLMVIVPGENPLEVEAFVENKDIGFVHGGQVAEVKIETFPFTKYGTLQGSVAQVSSDAIQDEKRGLVYAARVKLARTSLEVDGKTVNLTPGMAVTVEIKTGKRRVIEYFLSPLMQYSDESLRER
ncbi:MAG: HlyD family type I secretion periplasmic adaptor subunit [Pseudomonadota bacterium]|nr:HlyD family type I secretion periplasmic adaptor subunit [Pseudomonadota bacterium]